MRTKRMLLGVTAMAMAMGACESVTLPEGMAAVDVMAEGDGGNSGSVATSNVGSQGSSGSEMEGTVEIRARVWARTSTGAWVDLSGGSAKQAVVDAGRQGSGKVFMTGHVEADTYNRVRVEFEEVTARVSGGVTIDADSEWLTLGVDLGGGAKAVVERSVELRADAGSRSRLVIDLNASQWLSRANAGTGMATRADFESAVRIFVQR